MSTALIIDARGDKIIQEVGYNKGWAIRELVNGGGGQGILINNAGTPANHSYGAQDTNPDTSTVKLWNPPLSDWLLPRPRQFDVGWNSTPEFAYHVLPNSSWVFDIGAREFFEGSTPETSAPNDKWITLVTPPTPVNMGEVNWANFAAAAGRPSLPASMMMAGVTNVSIPGKITPYFQWLQYPEPEDIFVFGFGEFAFYHDARSNFLVRNTDFPSLQKWEVVWHHNNSHAYNFWQNSRYSPFAPTVHYQNIMVIPVGLTELYLLRNENSPPWIANTRPWPSSPSEQIRSGKWWIACPGNQKVAFQAQTMAYQYGQHRPPVLLDTNQLTPEAEWFNFGQEYAPNSGGDPSLGPFINARWDLHRKLGDNVAVTQENASFEAINNTDGQYIFLQLLDERSRGWVSDGTHFRGTMLVEINPNTSGGDTLFGRDCWSPQIREIYCNIPTKQIDRPYKQLILWDQVWYHGGQKVPGGFKPDWAYTSSLKEPRSKRLSLSLTSYGAAMMVAADLADKHDYSIALVTPPDETFDAKGNVVFPGSITWDDTNKQYVGEMVRAWVEEPANFGEMAQQPVWSLPVPSDFPPPIGGEPIVFPPHVIGHNTIYDGEIHARGMMERADEPWLFMSLLQAPLNDGSLTHLAAVTAAFQQSGFDPSNPRSLFIGPDTDPMNMQILLGYAVTKFGESGTVKNQGYAPDWDEGKLEYAWRICNEWKKWLLYEEMGGRVVYRADPLDLIYKRQSLTLPIEATFYRTEVNAASAGQDPRQVYHTASRVFTHPVKHNVIRILPATGTLPQVVVQDLRGCKPPNPSGTWAVGFGDPTYENYVGYQVRPHVVHPKMGNDYSALYQIAVMALIRFRRRIRSRVWSCDMRPQEIGIAGGSHGIELGSIVGIEDAIPGTPTKYQVVKMGVVQLGHKKYRTTLTGEILPLPVQVGDI